MPLILEVTPELESQIRSAAAQAGISPDAYVLESVTARLAQKRQRSSKGNRLSQTEADLLQKINRSLSQIQWMRYRTLIAKRHAETLTPEEQTELIALSDQIEEANSKRMGYVAELAQVRRTTIPVLMRELGLQPAR
ncbi:MAG: hypothetical protein M3Q45_07825 [Chloroflexota bacterium]|nr:hypothetical protein [Chloroflexota bacterium]